MIVGIGRSAFLFCFVNIFVEAPPRRLRPDDHATGIHCDTEGSSSDHRHSFLLHSQPN